MPKLAAIQMASGPNVNANLIEAERLIGEAATAGAELIVLPENFGLMGLKETDKLGLAEDEGVGPLQEFLSQQAQRHNVWLAGGTIPLKASDPDKVLSSCLLYNNQGERIARYDKIHLFDVDLTDSNEQYAESETIEPGNKIVVVDSPFGKLGLAVCYDLRFPELFRDMIDMGAEIILLPAAFTAITGKAHWETLLRARAIENLGYIVASAQGGYHASGRETHGDSMIVEPWGTVVARQPSGAGFVVAEIDRLRLLRLRETFPVLSHRRLQCNLSA